jgi:2,5-diketo-D-gluconate reductase B
MTKDYKIGFGTGRLERESELSSIKRAIEKGYRFLDTARFYENEQAIQHAIDVTGIDRDKLCIGTKIHSKKLNTDDVFEEVETSLANLGTDYIDILYVHWPVHTYDPKETLQAFTELKSDGVINSIGICNVTAELLCEALDECPSLDYVQIELHPCLQQPKILDIVKQENLTAVAASPLANGRMLSHKTVQEIASRNSVSPSQLVLSWCMEQNAIPIPCSSAADHIRENFDSVSVEIPEREINLVNGIDGRFRVNDYDYSPWN